MTISSSTRKAGPYTGNGVTTSFSFSFKVFTAADLQVVKTDLAGVESNLVLGTDYTVTLNANQNSNPGGSITATSAPASGIKITITSDLAYTQPVDLTNQGGFYPDVINAALDRATIQIQQLNEQVGRSAKLPISNQTDADALSADIVRLAASANNIDIVANDKANVDAVAGNATNINTVAGSIANVNAVGNNIANVNAVAGNATNINAVNANSANITAVAGNATNINAVNANSANINTVAGNNTNVTTVATNIASVNSAASNMAAIIDAPNQAAAAASSAAAAAASAASGMYSAVQDKSTNYTVVSGDAGDLIRVTTSGGARTITLPQISGAGIGDGFKIAIVKWTGDANAVTVARSGSDTINGATSYTIGNQYSSVTFVADLETAQWFAAASGLGTTNANVDTFSGDGSTVAFTLSGDPGTKNNTMVEVGGVYQNKATYSVSGTTLTFSTAPANGVSIEVNWNSPLAIGAPSDDTVSTAKLQASSVTTAKIADANVTTAKLADGALAATTQGLAKMADGFFTATAGALAKFADGFLSATTAGRAKMADLFVTTAKLDNNAVTPAKMANSGSEFGLNNRIINSRMEIDQANSGAAVTHSGGGDMYGPDMFVFNSNGTPQFSVQQVADAPPGYKYSAKITTTTAGTPAAGDFSYFAQYIEGVMVSDLAFGTASASPVTASFWVKSSLTGTFGAALKNGTNNRAYPFSFTINSANTWEQKFVNIPGDTTGTWATDNTIGMKLSIDIGSGPNNKGTAGAWNATANIGVTGGVNLVATAGATMNITGLDLRKGTYPSAPPADWRPYGTELALCQRYFQLFGGAGGAATSSQIHANCKFPVEMRAAPTVAVFNATSSLVGLNRPAANATGVASVWQVDRYSAGVAVNSSDTGMTAGSVAWLFGQCLSASARL